MNEQANQRAAGNESCPPSTTGLAAPFLSLAVRIARATERLHEAGVQQAQAIRRSIVH
jgi:hypothetical protein